MESPDIVPRRSSTRYVSYGPPIAHGVRPSASKVHEPSSVGTTGTSMWYKLSGKTNMAIWITLAGLAVTAVVIVLFMPKYSYWAAAYGHLASYVVMFVLSAVLGAKYYPIPYRWGRLALIVLVMGGCMLCH